MINCFHTLVSTSTCAPPLRLAAHLTEQATSVEHTFKQADSDGSGYLDLAELTKLVRPSAWSVS